MSDRTPSNIPASIKQRLLNLSREKHELFNLVALRYANERFLYRLSKSVRAKQFVLKGATLFAHWMDEPHRATRDIDFLSYGDTSNVAVAAIVKEILQTPVEDDGLTFDEDGVSVQEIREETEYGGLRVKFSAYLDKMSISMQVDIGFGDIPGNLEQVTIHPMLNQSAPRLRAYPKEAVVAEKFHAMVEKGIANSRMKDFVDVWLLCQEFDFSGKPLAEAIEATFKSRGLSLPNKTPVALSDAFSADAGKIAQMRSFIADKTNLEEASLELAEIVDELRDFLMPVVGATMEGSAENMTWVAGGPWKKTT